MRSFLIDVVAPLIPFFAVTGVIAGLSGGDEKIVGVGVALALIPLAAFAVWNSGYRQGTTGQSIGRRVTKTKLVKIETDEPIGFGMALLRLICVAVTVGIWFIGFLSYLWPLWDPKRQTVADKIVKAVVVRIDDATT